MRHSLRTLVHHEDAMMNRTWKVQHLLAASVMTPLLLATTACGSGDGARDGARTDSAGGTVAMSDSAGATSVGGESMPNNTGQSDASVAQLLAVVNRNEIAAGRLAGTKARNADVKAYARQMVDEHQRAMQQLTTLASSTGWMVDSASMSGMMGTGGGTGSGTGMGSGSGAATGTGTGTGSGTGTGTGTGSGSAAGTGTGAAGTGTGTGATGATGATGGTGTTGSAGAGAGSTAGGGSSNGSLMVLMQQMNQANTSAMQTMRSQSGAAFDRAYMDSQVAAHQQTLDVLRQQATNIQNTELRTHVTTLQGSIETHLKQATDIRTRLGGATGTGTGGTGGTP
ncbi:MAG TPA: DUF4142 domain-containing protein [Gemmatimonas sp.]|nr:DUF4142 domain-containing protein [Gemmatimonas sp.]